MLAFLKGLGRRQELPLQTGSPDIVSSQGTASPTHLSDFPIRSL